METGKSTKGNKFSATKSKKSHYTHYCGLASQPIFSLFLNGASRSGGNAIFSGSAVCVSGGILAGAVLLGTLQGHVPHALYRLRSVPASGHAAQCSVGGLVIKHISVIFLIRPMAQRKRYITMEVLTELRIAQPTVYSLNSLERKKIL